MKECLLCGKEFIYTNEKDKRTTKRKFCSYLCQTRYNSMIQYRFRKNTILKNANPELFKRLILKNYYENKDEWYSRNKTYFLLSQLKFKDKLLNPFCKICGNKEDLQIHHEVYPRKIMDILDTILNNKIYYLCKKCHYNLTNSLKHKV